MVDEDGHVIPHDAEDISDSDFLVRGIPQQQIVHGRISSGAFKSASDPYKGLSVDLEKETMANAYPNDKHVGAVKFRVSVPRSQGLLVGREPLETNAAHCNV